MMLYTLLAGTPMIVCAVMTTLLVLETIKTKSPSHRILSVFFSVCTLLYMSHLIYFIRATAYIPYTNSIYSFCNLAVYPLYYIYLKQSLARELGDGTLMNDAALDLANRYLMSGMYYSSKEILDTLGTTHAFSPEQLEVYYRAQAKLYHSLVLVNKDPALSERFKKQELNFLDLSKPLSSPNCLNYNTDLAESLISKGQCSQARKALSEFLKNDGVSKQDAAIIHYWMAKSCRAEGNKDQALMQYQYFVGDTNLFASEDGVVIPK